MRIQSKLSKSNYSLIGRPRAERIKQTSKWKSKRVHDSQFVNCFISLIGCTRCTHNLKTNNRFILYALLNNVLHYRYIANCYCLRWKAPATTPQRKSDSQDKRIQWASEIDRDKANTSSNNHNQNTLYFCLKNSNSRAYETSLNLNDILTLTQICNKTLRFWQFKIADR